MKALLALAVAIGILIPTSGEIQSSKKLPTVNHSMTDLQLAELARKVTVRIKRGEGADQSWGSGVWLDTEGRVATCWHVLKDSNGKITVNLGLEKVDLEHEIVYDASFDVLEAHIIASDPLADVAILQVTQNPFRKPPHKIVQGSFNLSTEFAVPKLSQGVPSIGEKLILGGYPLDGAHFIVTFGNMAGIGMAAVPPGSRSQFIKFFRLYSSLLSNPADSGGPILNKNGELVGLMQGYQFVPVTDQHGKAIAFRQSPQGEITQMVSNSGISALVPAKFVQDALNSISSH